MTKWRNIEIGKIINFNPSEKLVQGTLAKKIPMDKLRPFQRKINGYEVSTYSNGPKFRNGDTLLAKITPCLENGKTAQVDILNDGEVAFGSSEFIVLRENDHSINEFIYYLAQSPAFRKRAIGCMEGTSGRKRVNEGALKLQVLPIPDKATQKRVASVLSSLDNKIELNQKINAELEAMAKTLYDYWFVQFDFPDENGKPYKSSGSTMVYNVQLKRDIPEGWEIKILASISKTASGGTPLSSRRDYYENGNIPWINSGELNKDYIISTANFITQKGLENSSAKIFPSDTILMAMYGATAGKVSLLQIEACTNQAICAIIPNSKSSVFYLKCALDDLYSYLIGLSSGSARDNLSQDNIRDLMLVIPTESILEKFNNSVIPIKNKIVSNLKQNQQLTQLRNWLLPMLMNGQVTVADAYQEEEKSYAIAAEPAAEYNQSITLPIPENRKGFAKQVLGGKIVSLFKDDPHFTHIKFQKLQFLAEHIVEADLNLNYYFQAAGPHDGAYMNTIANHFRTNQWFDEQNYRFLPLKKQNKIEGYYQDYFSPVANRLERLFTLLANATEAEAEIIATLYAVWNNRIILKQPVSEEALIEDFYNWSDRKQQYTKEQLLEGLQWLKINNMEPKGFGKEIKRAKSKS